MWTYEILVSVQPNLDFSFSSSEVTNNKSTDWNYELLNLLLYEITVDWGQLLIEISAF